MNAVIQSWAALYSNHAWLRSAIVFAHVGSLLIGGGGAVAADRATLRAFSRGPDERARQLESIARTHRLVLVALAVIIVSGLLQFFSDTGTFLHSWIFWTKMGLIVLLLANGAWLTQAATPAGSDWSRLRIASILSLGLWVTITFFGAALISH